MEIANINVLVWNVRGLNARSRRDSLRMLVADSTASIVCIQETKLSVILPFLMAGMLGSSFLAFDYLPAAGTRGGILTACRSPAMSCGRVHAGRHSLTVSVQIQDHDMPWTLTNVYGPQPDIDKVEFLEELRLVHSLASPMWIVVGDFNLILRAAEKNTSNVNRRNIGRFRRFVDDVSLKEVYLHGRRYTWSNERQAPVMAQLDRVLVYTQQVWHSVDQRIGCASLSPTAGSPFLDWWLLRRRSFLGASKKGFDTTFILVSWHIWKERNHRVFTGDTQRTPQQLAVAITEEAAIWCSAGAHCRYTIGWHFQS
uniref:Endonuclease/exonuclease/phosphatase domain-containing protein n=1 Tax=Setaria viridis TaxID=4556 RepID=A0A4U6VFG2_SETVI|nr:hypothetical protein SEVIR_3G238700v2 [Setaria viridis]